ncbi:MAG: hypothetical protein AAGE52_40745 [Myxococcota bacterium]
MDQEEANRELWEKVSAVQDRRVAGSVSIDELLDDAVELVAIARRPEYDSCQSRLCAYDQLIAVYEILDPVGYAPEVEKTTRELRQETGPETACFFCLAVSQTRAARLQGHLDRARRIYEETTALLPRNYVGLYYRMRLAAQRIHLALAEKNGPAARAAFEILTGTGAFMQKQWGHVESIRSRLLDNEELIREMEVLVLLAEGHPQEAHEIYLEGCHRDAPNPGRLAVQHDLVAALERENDVDLAAILDDMATFAAQRTYPRDLARVALVQLRVARARGSDESQPIATLHKALPRLRASDLHEEAKALGVEV